MEENAKRSGYEPSDDENWEGRNRILEKMKRGEKVDGSWDLAVL